MPTRAELEKPAIVMCAIAGVVLAAVSVPFLPVLYCESPAAQCKDGSPNPVDFDVTWFEIPLGAPQSFSGTGDAGSDAATIAATSSIPANFHIRAACDDAFNAEADFGQNPVTVTWMLNRTAAGGSTKVGGGEFTCADGLNETVERYDHPDVARVQALDEEGAAQALAQHPDVVAQPETAEYTLTVSWARPPPRVQVPPGLPVGQTSFSLAVDFDATAWDAAVTLAPVPEVGR